MIRQQSRDLINEILTYPLLENAGKPGADLHGVKVMSWEEAICAAQHREWESICQACSNRINQRFVRSGLHGDRSWNSLVPEVNRMLAPVIKRIEEYFAVRHGPWGLSGQIIFQLRSAVEESEYSDLAPPLFFLPHLIPIYRSGHYPCGWEGKSVPRSQLDGSLETLPDGRVKVF